MRTASTKNGVGPTVGSTAPTFSSNTRPADVGMERSPEHAHKCGRSNPTKPEHFMSEPEPIPEHLDRLGGEAQSVLAVLVLAALWPSRYPGGWVSIRALAKTAVLLGERADQESLKAAVRRGLRQLGQVSGAPRIECRRTHDHDPISDRLRRDRDRRLTDPVCSTLETWLVRRGSELISADTWRHFLPAKEEATDHARSATRAILRQSLRQADACLGLAAQLVRPGTREGALLRRVRRVLNESLRGIEASDRPGTGPRDGS